MNKSVVYLFVSVFFLFTSCEYRLGENFMDFEKWQADSVAMSVDFYGPFIHEADRPHWRDGMGKRWDTM